MRNASGRVAPTASSPAGTSTASIASVAYATDDSASDDSTARPVTFVSRSCGACEEGSRRPSRTRLNGLNTCPRSRTRRGSRLRRVQKFGQLADKQRVLRKFRDERRQLRPGEIGLLLAQGGQGQQNFRERPEVPAARRDDLKLPNAFALVAADPGEAEKEPLVQGLASDHVIRRAEDQV